VRQLKKKRRRDGYNGVEVCKEGREKGQGEGGGTIVGEYAENQEEGGLGERRLERSKSAKG
jgi:hypothetical protein